LDPKILIIILNKFKKLNILNSNLANKRPVKSSEGLITWKLIESKMPWSLMFLLGGGFAISKGSNASCLSTKVGESLVPLKDYPPLIILGVILIFVSCVTEFTSNIGIANIILPVIAQLVNIFTFV
jgi:sodium-dependent dicarboxylate transporter 2/3/5